MHLTNRPEISNEIDTFDNTIGRIPFGRGLRRRRSVSDNVIGVAPPTARSVDKDWTLLTVDFDISGRWH